MKALSLTQPWATLVANGSKIVETRGFQPRSLMPGEDFAIHAAKNFPVDCRQLCDQTPLYRLGMRRVGCMPCINCSKDELSEIARRFPQHIDKIREWESLLAQAAKRGFSTFFTDRLLDIPTGELRWDEDEDGELLPVSVTRPETNAEIFARLNIDARVQWANTVRGGKQFALFKAGEPNECQSVYGLCE